MVLSASISQRIPELAASGQSQKKPEEDYAVRTQLKRKESILQKILIVFHGVLAFLRETSTFVPSLFCVLVP